MKYFLILISLVTISFTTADLDCGNFKYGDSPELVKSRETAQFIGEEILRQNLKGLNFADVNEKGITLYSYIFLSDKLNGLKIKKMSRNGSNSYMQAYNDYMEALARYNSICDVKIKEKHDDGGLRSFHVVSDKSKIYVMMQKESQDFFLVENIFKK